LWKEPEGLGAATLTNGTARPTSSAILAATGMAAATKPPLAARNCRRSMAGSWPCFLIGVPWQTQRSSGDNRPPQLYDERKCRQAGKSFFYWNYEDFRPLGRERQGPGVRG